MADKLCFSDAEWRDIFLPRYARDPVRFSREICGVEPCEWQAVFLRELARPKRDGTRCALASGHETGKTFIICVAMLWGVCVFPDCHIYATSATKDQLETRLWVYMRRLIEDSRVSLWFDVDSVKAVNKHIPGNAIYCRAWSKDKPQSWAGEHCYSAWGVFDECSDIDQSIHDAWSGSAYKKNAFTVLMSQPRIRSGALFNAFHSERKRWWCRHISSLESPFSTKAYADSIAEAYGENSDFYRIRVLGLFPQTDSSAMFPDAHLKAVEDFKAAGFPVAGFDPAAGGRDKSILVFRRGNAIAGIHKFDESSENHPVLGKMVLACMDSYGCNVVAMDTNGIGHGLGQFLPVMARVTVVPVLGQERAKNPKKYHDRRSEAYGRLAEAWKNLRFASGVSPEDLRKTARQLSTVKMFFDKALRISVLPKGELKKELGGESPDYADALAYSFMAGECNAPSGAGAGAPGGSARPPQDVWTGRGSMDIWGPSASGQRIW